MGFFHDHKLFMLIFMAVVFLTIVTVDAVMSGIDNRATISQIAAYWAHRHPVSLCVLMLALGMLLGHLFFYQTISPK
jgi:hypothetical protein